jgi:putative membrane protein
MKYLLRIAIMTIVILGLPYIFSDISVAGWYPALLTALLLAVINLVVKPIVSIITLPVNVITLGLSGLIINGAFLYYVGSLIDGFVVGSFLSAFLGALVLSAVNWVVSRI